MSAFEQKFNVGKTIEKTPQCSTSQEIQDQMLQYYQLQKDTIVNDYQKHRSYFDPKTKASPLALHSYRLLLDPENHPSAVDSTRFAQTELDSSLSD